MKSGPPPTPTRLKLLRGNPGKRNQHERAEAAAGDSAVPQPPGQGREAGVAESQQGATRARTHL